MAKKVTIKTVLKNGKINVHSYDRVPEIRFPCSAKLKEQIYNIIANLGIDSPAFFKMKMREIVDSYPEKMKLPQTNE